FASKYPGVTTYGFYSGRLNNGGDTITLNTSADATIFSFHYNDAAPWPTTADGLGFSVVPINSNTIVNFGDAKQWRASTNIGGSPGADDPAYTIAGIKVNEALAHTDLPNHDYIELFNP